MCKEYRHYFIQSMYL